MTTQPIEPQPVDFTPAPYGTGSTYPEVVSALLGKYREVVK